MSNRIYASAISPEQMPLLLAGFQLACVAIREASGSPSPLPIECQHRLAAYLIAQVQNGEADAASLALKAVAHQQAFTDELYVN